MAPQATIDLVIASDTVLESGLFLAAEHAVYGNIAPIISLSFGFCEPEIGAEGAFLNNLWEQAAAQGITVAVSTGDNGSAGPLGFPISDENAVGDLLVSNFEHGRIEYNPKTGQVEVTVNGKVVPSGL